MTTVGKVATMTEATMTVAAVTVPPMAAMAPIMVPISGTAIDARAVVMTMTAIVPASIKVMQATAVIGIAKKQAESETIRGCITGGYQSQGECSSSNHRFDSLAHDQSSTVSVGTHLERYYIVTNLN